MTQNETPQRPAEPSAVDSVEKMERAYSNRVPDRDLTLRVHPLSLKFVQVPDGTKCVILVTPDQPVGYIAVVEEDDIG